MDLQKYEASSNLRKKGYATPLILGGNPSTLAFEKLRTMKEIMLQIYSFLPLRDRVSSLASVHRNFLEDPTRYGCLRTIFSGHFSSITHVVEELDEWNEDQIKSLIAKQNLLEAKFQNDSVTEKRRLAIKDKFRKKQQRYEKPLDERIDRRRRIAKLKKKADSLECHDLNPISKRNAVEIVIGSTIWPPRRLH